MELGAVVGGEGFEHLRRPGNEFVESSIGGGGGVVVELSDQGAAAGSFDDREDAVGAGPVDGIDFPVVEFLP